MDFHKDNYPNKPRFKSPRSERPHGCNYWVEIRDGEDPSRAYRRIKKKIKDDKFFEEVKERQYYRKPSEKRQERLKKRRLVIKRLTQTAEEDRGGRSFKRLF